MCFGKPGIYSAVLLSLAVTSPAISRSQSSGSSGLDTAAGFHQDAIRLKRQSNVCLTPENNPGQCVPKKDCPQYVALSKLMDTLAYVADYLESAVCRLPSSPKRQRFEFGYCCNLDVQDRRPVTAVNDPFPANCGQTYGLRDKIVGGVRAERYAWPWMARIGYQSRANRGVAWVCGGTLITEKHVLTAAHCMPEDVSHRKFVRLGAHDFEDPNETSVKDIPIADVIMHETYHANNVKYPELATHYGYDIALLVLQTTVVFQAGVISPICLPVATLHSGDSLDRKKYDVWAAGWGKTEFSLQSSSHLREVRMGIVPNKKCQRSYSAARIYITDPMLCAGSPGGGKDTCQGDSGGPLMVLETVREKQQFYQVGIVSFGYDCGLADFPGVYTRVSSFMDWIEKEVRETY